MRKFDEWETRHLIRALDLYQDGLDNIVSGFQGPPASVPDWVINDDARNKQLLKTFKLSLKKKLEWNNMVKEWME